MTIIRRMMNDRFQDPCSQAWLDQLADAVNRSANDSRNILGDLNGNRCRTQGTRRFLL